MTLVRRELHIDKDGSAWNSSSLTMKNEGMTTGVVYQHPIGYLAIGHVIQNLQPDGTAVVCLAQVGPAPFIRVFSKSDNRCLTLTSLHQA